MSNVDEAEWLAAIETAHGPRCGLESGTLPYDINLKDLDVYIAGVVRWLNAAGFETTHSCDGHTTRAAELDFRNWRMKPLFGYCLKTLSRGEWEYRGRHLLEAENAPCSKRTQETTSQSYGRMWLLDVAEALHRHQVDLRDFVRAAQRLAQSAQ